MRYLKISLATLAVLALWTAIPVTGALYGWWREPVAPPGDAAAFMRVAVGRIEAADPGNAALVLIENGAVVDEHYHTVDEPVNRDTVFPVASMSKWLTAWGVMALVESGRLDPDRPVEDYLTRWRMPESPFDSRGVTARRLLSHTAGLTDGLGFADYGADEAVPSLEQSLADPRASSGGPVRIAPGLEPGSEWRYSGGGYLILELLVEELTGESFESYMGRAVFRPLGMNRATYEYPGALDNAAESYDADGRRAPLYRYASSAATGLAASAGDLTRFLLAQISGAAPAVPLDPATQRAMRAPHGFALGQGIWGLGTILYAPTAGGGFVFGHDGGNEPALNATARINPDTGDGLIVLVSGHARLATEIGFHWVFWQTGEPDFFHAESEVRRVMPAVLAGWGVILVAAVIVALTGGRRRAG